MHPEIVESLDSRLTEYLKQVKGGLPAPNPDYDPEGTRSGDRKKGGGRKKK